MVELQAPHRKWYINKQSVLNILTTCFSGRILALANLYGINIPTMTNFKMLTWHQLPSTILEIVTTGSSKSVLLSPVVYHTNTASPSFAPFLSHAHPRPVPCPSSAFTEIWPFQDGGPRMFGASEEAVSASGSFLNFDIFLVTRTAFLNVTSLSCC